MSRTILFMAMAALGPVGLLQAVESVVDLAGESAEPEPVAESGGSWWTRDRKTAGVLIASNAAIVAYGFAFWDYGSSTGFATKDEDWFGADTASGGADKLGHAYTAATLTNVSANVFREWGYTRQEAANRGALLGLSVTAVMELGDGISDDFGYSHEDMVANVVGTGVGYLRARYPWVAERVDFRAEYWPSEAVTSGESIDIVTDYEGMRYLLAFKAAGWIDGRDNPLRYLEAHVGYFARGFEEDAHNEDEFGRYAYLGIGINLTELWHRWRGGSGETVFNYYQVPYTSLRYDHNFDG